MGGRRRFKQQHTVLLRHHKARATLQLDSYEAEMIYRAEVPVFDKRVGGRRKTMHSFLLPHEAMADIAAVNSEYLKLDTVAEAGPWSKRVEAARVRVETTLDGKYLALCGLFIDAAPYQKRDSILCYYWNPATSLCFVLSIDHAEC